MRLIDANSIKFRPYYDEYVDYDGYINDLKTWQLDDVLSDRVDNTPTVEAIPVEWLKTQIEKCQEISNTSKTVGLAILAETIKQWEKENEID